MTNKPNDVRVSRELLPCPFCGQQDAFVEQLDSDASVVICQGRVGEHSACLARGPVGVQESDDEDQPGRNAAVREWNRRPQPADQQGEPVGWTTPGMLSITKDVDGPHSRFGARKNRSTRFCVPLYLSAWPATAKVDERAEFETWFTQNAQCDNLCIGIQMMKASRGDNGDYAGYPHISDAWRAWQARAKLNGVSKVLLPERRPEPSCVTAIDDDRENAVWNACLDEVAKLNTPQ